MINNIIVVVVVAVDRVRSASEDNFFFVCLTLPTATTEEIDRPLKMHSEKRLLDVVFRSTSAALLRLASSGKRRIM